MCVWALYECRLGVYGCVMCAHNRAQIRPCAYHMRSQFVRPTIVCMAMRKRIARPLARRCALMLAHVQAHIMRMDAHAQYV